MTPPPNLEGSSKCFRAFLVVVRSGCCWHSVVAARDAKCPVAYRITLDLGRNPPRSADKLAEKLQKFQAELSALLSYSQA